ncbi:MAG: lysozyme [SAR324 cluster bacterium]|nr:lysozyme [SAR324 cluster bacterium]
MHTKSLEKLFELLKEHEGYRAKPYFCSREKLTIGYGRNLEDNGIRPDEGDLMLENDLSQCHLELKSKFRWFDALPDDAKIVLIDMCFNLGLAGLLKFKKTLAAFEAQDWKVAATEMMDSYWANQVGRRATNLRDMVLGLEDIPSYNQLNNELSRLKEQLHSLQGNPC